VIGGAHHDASREGNGQRAAECDRPGIERGHKVSDQAGHRKSHHECSGDAQSDRLAVAPQVRLVEPHARDDEHHAQGERDHLGRDGRAGARERRAGTRDIQRDADQRRIEQDQDFQRGEDDQPAGNVVTEDMNHGFTLPPRFV
jgi:hypothetical protein